jgi:hypothetical protein
VRPARSLAAAAAVGFAALLSGCGGASPVDPGALAAAPASGSGGAVTPFATEELIGDWGTASFHREEDRARVEAQARTQCRLPYSITKGPTDGVMMYFADDPKLYELKVKTAADGRVYIGFEGPPGGWQDREVLSYTRDMLVIRFVEPSIHARYGTLVFVRCNPSART